MIMERGFTIRKSDGNLWQTYNGLKHLYIAENENHFNEFKIEPGSSDLKAKPFLIPTYYLYFSGAVW